jgi:AcrR family transcriptional regulator
MARPPEHDKRSELAKSAVDVLEREGLEISTTRLAEALGIKRPTLLYHFPTLGDVVEQALRDLLLEQAAYVSGRIAGVEHPLDRLAAQLEAVAEFHRGREARVVFLTQAIAALSGARLAELLEAGSELFAAQRRANVERIERGIAEGTVAPCDAEALVVLVRALTDGLMLQRVTGDTELAPVHALLRERLFEPLKRAPKNVGRARPSQSSIRNEVRSTGGTK